MVSKRELKRKVKFFKAVTSITFNYSRDLIEEAREEIDGLYHQLNVVKEDKLDLIDDNLQLSAEVKELRKLKQELIEKDKVMEMLADEREAQWETIMVLKDLVCPIKLAHAKRVNPNLKLMGIN